MPAVRRHQGAGEGGGHAAEPLPATPAARQSKGGDSSACLARPAPPPATRRGDRPPCALNTAAMLILYRKTPSNMINCRYCSKCFPESLDGLAVKTFHEILHDEVED